MKCLDAVDEEGRTRYEVTVMNLIGESSLVVRYLSELDKIGQTSAAPVSSLLRDPRDHVSIQNKRQRDVRAHPNIRFILEVQALMEDSENKRDRMFFNAVWMNLCFDGKYFKWVDRMDGQSIDLSTEANNNGFADDIKVYLENIKEQGKSKLDAGN